MQRKKEGNKNCAKKERRKKEMCNERKNCARKEGMKEGRTVQGKKGRKKEELCKERKNERRKNSLALLYLSESSQSSRSL